MRTKCGAYLVVVMLAALTPARATAQSSIVIRSIEIADSGGVTNVTIVADGPLPLPSPASLNDPPRIFFDLPGVSHQIKGGAAVAPDGGVVRGVRVALRTANPPLTRVVVDLNRFEGHRVDANDRKAGRIRIVVGAEAANRPAPAPPRAAVPPRPAPATTTPSPAPVIPAPVPISESPRPEPAASNSTPATMPAAGSTAPARTPPATPTSPARSPVLSSETPRPALPDVEVAAYRKQVFAELGRMEALRALVAKIDAGETVAPDALTSAAQEFADLRRKLEAVQPAPVLAVTHDLLMTSCTFGAMASRLGIEAAQANNPETKGRAASAAAGSLMLFDRACAALNCARPPR